MSARENPITHPDENLLAAFAEQALKGAERESIVLHLSACARCRHIVFLAQDAAAELENAPQPTPRPAPARWRPWRLATAAASLLVLAGISALIWHGYRHTPPETQQAMVKPGAPPAASPAQATPAAKPSPKPAPAPVPQKQPSVQSEELKSLPSRQINGAVNELQAPAVDGAARLAPPPSEPAPPQNALAGIPQTPPSQKKQVLPQQANPLMMQVAPAGSQQAAPPPLFSSSRQALGSTAEGGAMDAPTNAGLQPHVSPPVTDAFAAVTTPRYSVVDGNVERRDAAGQTALELPLGAQAQSIASHAGTLLLLTRAGTLYRSPDLGEHWIKVPVQWTGKPATLQAKLEPALSAPSNAAASSNAKTAQGNIPRTGVSSLGSLRADNTAGAAQKTAPAAKAGAGKPAETTPAAPAPAIFVLTNETGQSWISHDGGRTWQPDQP